MALAAHARLFIRGKIGSAQTWSTGVGLQPTVIAEPDPVTLVDYLAAVEPAVAAWWSSNSIGGMCAPDTTLNSLGMSWYPAGATKAAVQAEQVLTAIPGKAASTALPTFVSMVVTLRTGTVGRSGRGRMYVPSTGQQLDAHQWTQATLTEAANSTATMLKALAAALGAVFTPVVASATGNHLITSVKIDSLPDVQHRREDKIGALFQAFSLV